MGLGLMMLRGLKDSLAARCKLEVHVDRIICGTFMETHMSFFASTCQAFELQDRNFSLRLVIGSDWHASLSPIFQSKDCCTTCCVMQNDALVHHCLKNYLSIGTIKLAASRYGSFSK